MQRENRNKNVGQAMPDSKGNSFWKNEIRLIIRQAEPDLRVTTTNAFTLIELLVVVLIIGILVAVALPQYQKAVIKSRFAGLKILTKSLADAEEAYYLANGEYTRDLDILGVMPEGKLNTSTTNQFDYPWGYCYAHTPVPGGTNSAVVFCVNTQHSIRYDKYLLFSAYVPGVAKCVVINATGVNDIRNQICKAETGSSTYDVADTTYWWNYQ